MSKDLEAATNTYAELLRLHRLNDELLENALSNPSLD